MLCMATKKTKRASGHLNRLVGVRLTDRVVKAAEAYAKREKRKLSPMCAILIEEALIARGGLVPEEEGE